MSRCQQDPPPNPHTLTLAPSQVDFAYNAGASGTTPQTTIQPRITGKHSEMERERFGERCRFLESGFACRGACFDQKCAGVRAVTVPSCSKIICHYPRVEAALYLAQYQLHFPGDRKGKMSPKSRLGSLQPPHWPLAPQTAAPGPWSSSPGPPNSGTCPSAASSLSLSSPKQKLFNVPAAPGTSFKETSGPGQSRLVTRKK